MKKKTADRERDERCDQCCFDIGSDRQVASLFDYLTYSDIVLFIYPVDEVFMRL